ncbi:hypothetical protein G4V62_02685 [Bacillaceae bacterium SIJ1]|uniref:GbsR/MarR family transcriptional regulator n=1 Tax=Litoribacterium kuwaitense TaxID=1398745 RepID=UPI0013EC4725|nr:helix-turn-helix domain-containing protein [Litoribacterium kuwaitense]NGP43906.1 hypothetical protein [Litoribacterium kuwaitense]
MEKKTASELFQVYTQWIQIYGLTTSEARVLSRLYIDQEPKSTDDLSFSLGMSKTTVNKNLRTLAHMNMVQKVWVKGSRKDHFIPEQDLYKQFKHGMTDPLLSHIKKQQESLIQIQKHGHYSDLDCQVKTLAHFLKVTRKLIEDLDHGMTKS